MLLQGVRLVHGQGGEPECQGAYPGACEGVPLPEMAYCAVLPQVTVKQTLQAHAAWAGQGHSSNIGSHLLSCKACSSIMAQAAVNCSSSCCGVILGCRMQDIGMDPRRPDTRVYGTSLAQPWHTDSSDIVGMGTWQLKRQRQLTTG